MKILLLDNAIDSFEWALRHLRSFLEIDSHFEQPDMSTTYLKQSILSLNNALELFFKAKISHINPLLIYKNLNTDVLPFDIINYYAKKQSNEINEPLYNYIVTNSDLHTIDYSKCIDLYCTLYSVPDGCKKDFQELNTLRNGLTHLGINDQTEYYILAGRIARILLYSHYHIFRNLDYDLPKTENIISEIFTIEFTLASLEENIWFDIQSTKIEIICKEIEKHFNSNEIKNYMKEKHIDASLGLTLDAEYISFLITMMYDNHEQEFAAAYSNATNNALIISDASKNDGPIYGIIELPKSDTTPSKFYISLNDTGTVIPSFDEQGAFWKSKEYKKHFAYVPFGKTKIIEMLKEIINLMSITDFVPFEDFVNE